MAAAEADVTDPQRRLLLASSVVVGAGLLLSAAGCGRDHIPKLEDVTPRPEGTFGMDRTESGPYEYPRVHKKLIKSDDPQLRLLARYEQRLGHGVKSMPMVVGLPRNAAEAERQGMAMASRLHEWSKHGIKPVVFMEPTYQSGAQANPKELHTPGFVSVVDASPGVLSVYFRTLFRAGVTDEQMGTWIPYPDPREGTSVSPKLFKANVTGAAQCIKAHFRGAKVGVMLNGSNSREHLLKSTEDMPVGLIDSFGLQGFPRTPHDAASKFLNYRDAVACAKQLGVQDVWINTGTRLEHDTAERAAQLRAEFEQALAVQDSGYKVRVNIFAARHARDGNWSYTSGQGPELLHAAMAGAAEAGLETTFFDAP